MSKFTRRDGVQKPKEWKHDELAVDLAAHLRADGGRMTWLDFSPSGMGGARADVLALNKWQYSSPALVAYEVKISVSDFRSDTTSGKWMKYLDFAQGVVFAVPHGMVSTGDVPQGAGLIVRSERAWRTVRKPTLRAISLDVGGWLRLLNTRQAIRSWNTDPQYRESDYMRREAEGLARTRVYQEVGKRYGADIAKLLSAPEKARTLVAEAKEQAKKIVAEAHDDAAEIDKGWKELCRILDLPTTTPRSLISYKIRDRAKLLLENPTIADIAHRVRKALESLDGALVLDRIAAAGPAEDEDIDYEGELS